MKALIFITLIALCFAVDDRKGLDPAVCFASLQNLYPFMMKSVTELDKGITKATADAQIQVIDDMNTQFTKAVGQCGGRVYSLEVSNSIVSDFAECKKNVARLRDLVLYVDDLNLMSDPHEMPYFLRYAQIFNNLNQEILVQCL